MRYYVEKYTPVYCTVERVQYMMVKKVIKETAEQEFFYLAEEILQG